MSAADERTSLRQVVKDQVEDVEEEGYQAYLGKWMPCRTLAPVTFSFLQENRKQVLHVAYALCTAALVCCGFAWWGAFAHTNTLAHLPWAEIYSDKGVAYAGVRWVCYDLPTPPPEGTFGDGVSGTIANGPGHYWRCETWWDFDCKTSPAPHACGTCKHQSKAIVMSILLALSGFYSFYTQMGDRMRGNDSNYVKFMACFSALFGGTQFVISIMTYYRTCVYSVDTAEIHASPGAGLILMTVAAVLKVLMGLVHLGLPVEKSDKKSDV